MKLEAFDDANTVADAAAAAIAAEARRVVAARGRFTMALSGGRTPWIMLRALANEDVPWAGVHVFQVDERVAPAGHPDRNLTHLHESLFDRVSLPPAADPSDARGITRCRGRGRAVCSRSPRGRRNAAGA